ncbi:hypothetical protein PIB30_069814 [Stylosanthes scabra]|uniref:C2H2-type domain-containing protein n=1 Tax=Stylosanthes scabra TaxID=79078 RepID=A0ABU6QNZ5_9FABA|nr:hypothetical protein [Stylosanthes scabra]
MALIVDQQSNFKHFCKICKKGFGCGRALGGHMRAHGIGDESGHMDDDDPASDWEDRLGGNVPPSNKRMYALRTNPNRLKSCRVCENCGKEFLSWKSFLEHGKCTSEDAESLVSSPGSDAADDGIEPRRGCGWSKRKRSLRAKVGSFNYNCPSSEEEDLANCLMMLSNAIVDPLTVAAVELEESCASASKDEEQRRNPMNLIGPFSSYKVPNNDNNNNNNKAKGVAKGLFECKACKKVFNSHQALGGHRASHKKVKGCFAARLDNLDDSVAEDDVITQEEFFPTKSNSIFQFDHQSPHHHNQNNSATLASSSKRKSKVHECSICHRSFSSGQALGGHKRCHWITSNAPDTSTLARFQQFQEHLDQIPKFDSDPLVDLKLDLNLPAPINDLARRNNNNNNNVNVSTEIFLKPWAGGGGGGITAKKENNTNMKDDNSNNNNNSQSQISYHHPTNHNQIDQNENVVDGNKNNSNNPNNNNSINDLMQSVDNEADSKIKLAKLSELKDMNIGGSSSPWLQVGIGSTTTDVGTDQ